MLNIILSNINVMQFYKVLNTVFIVSPIPCSLTFYIIVPFKSYLPLTFLERVFCRYIETLSLVINYNGIILSISN